jgi:hypothetical protein
MQTALTNVIDTKLFAFVDALQITEVPPAHLPSSPLFSFTSRPKSPHLDRRAAAHLPSSRAISRHLAPSRAISSRLPLAFVGMLPVHLPAAFHDVAGLLMTWHEDDVAR